VDWVLKFRNDGSSDTPIIENILPLHWAMPSSPGDCFIRHARGSDARADERPNQTVKENGMLIAALGLRAATVENYGAKIVALDPNGTAALAGLGVGDIINRIDGKPVRTAMDLNIQLSNRQPGTVIELGFRIQGAWQSKAKILLGTAAQ